LLETLQREESLRNLAKAIALLPEDFKAALMLRIEGELSFKEIAEVVGTTEETARWRVFRARRILVDMVPGEVPEERKAKSQAGMPKTTPNPKKGGGL
jgi:RNA polymerase sigma-70 factor (ECF subfamily)